MCVQYILECSVQWGCSVHPVSTMSTSGDIMSTSAMLSTLGDTMSMSRDIMSTLGDVQYIGGYHDVCGGAR